MQERQNKNRLVDSQNKKIKVIERLKTEMTFFLQLAVLISVRGKLCVRGSSRMERVQLLRCLLEQS